MASRIDTYTEMREGLNSILDPGKNNQSKWKEFLPETVETKKVKEVLSLFAKTFSAMRIYPPENPTVKNFIESLYEKKQEFLREYGELKLVVHEFSFIFKEDTVFEEEQKKTSLPFLFFKDGMRELVFNKGLDKNELQDFLQITKDNADLPLEDSDIVNSLWAKDFPHIRYFALDEFLDTESEQDSADKRSRVDKEELLQGEIRLSTADLSEIRKRSAAPAASSSEAKKEEEGQEITLEDIPLPFQTTAISREDSPKLQSMLEELRSLPPLTEMIILLFEILHLEERAQAISSILNILKQFYKEAVYKSLFTLASLILHRLQELKELCSGQHEEKAQMLESTLRHFKGESSLAYLKKLFMNGQIEDFDSFFLYLKTLGPQAIPLAGDIWEETRDPDIRLKASDFLYEAGKEDLASLFNLVRGHRTALTKEIIEISGKIADKRALPYLKKFTGHQNKEVRLAVIKALSRIDDASVNPILIGFLSEHDGEIRTQAAMSLKSSEDQDTAAFIFQIAEQKDFRERLKQEKKALLEYLADTRSGEASTLLRSLLKKRSILKRSKQDETRLCAVPALQKMGNHEAQKILEEGARFRNKAIQIACKLALRKIS
ncbi:MAG: HEAT repeat domain-containing protein [Candidatus Aminicenantes bacterium]|nr:HEAT repeat domain-containing protein [Candidatus Aminicenantes bacterium]